MKRDIKREVRREKLGGMDAMEGIEKIEKIEGIEGNGKAENIVGEDKG